MATDVLTNAHFTWNSVDLSTHVQSISVPWTEEDVEDTAMGDSARSYLSGLETGQIQITFNADDAAGAVSATLWAGKGAARAFVIRRDAGVVSTTNPEYTGSAKLNSVDWVSGTVGDLATNPVSFTITTAVARATS